jgi:hypothetical protein
MREIVMKKFNIGKEMSSNYEFFEMVFWEFDIEDDNELIKDLKKRKICDNKSLHLDTFGANLIKMLNDEDNVISLVLKSHLYIENFLDHIIKKKFQKHELILDNSYLFHKKLKIIMSKNYLTENLYITIELINTIRNKYVHNLKYNIANFDFSQFPYCEDIYLSLKTKNIDVKKEAHIFVLKHIIFNLLINLTKKHPYISELKNDEV